MKIDPNLIIEKIENLSIDATLIYLAKSGIEKFVDGYESIKRAIQEKFNEGKYGFVPNREEALFIQKTRNNSEYKEIILLIPKYKYLELIRTGFLIKEYNRRIGNNIDKDKNKERVSEIKFRILSRPGGNSLLKIIKFSSTEFFSIVIKYLHNLKMNGYPEEHLENEFIDLTEEWTKDSLFVKNDSLIEEVKGWCQNKIENDVQRFFLFGLYNQPIKIIENVLEELKEKIIQKDYKIINFKEVEKELPVLEIIVYKKIIN